MRSIIFLLLVTGVFVLSVPAQNLKQTAVAVPTGIGNWSGEDSAKILNDPVIKVRLKKLLGQSSYASFMESFETVTPITKDGNVLFASGCLIHACTHLESAVAIDLSNNTIHAAIYNEERPTRFFNERRTKSPKQIVDWAKNLGT